ncbi:lipoprotein [Spiroplasma culicicola]|uniref:Lipoprotein n=1 Tax=Spiroplasma culicicola AES-1 TaxID=1276246 RepID=W6A6R2_9MOLU|nr:lipoprotein [Spiroplasma culicicola]AHI52788.1 hypothetical protein SCULI_v1c04470 [Spiroplasma culicicola AES-1]
MKKLLTLLASFSLISSSSAIVVACTGDVYSVKYKQDDGKLQEIININLEDLKAYDNIKDLYDDVYKEIKDQNSIIPANSNEYIEREAIYIVETYSISVLNSSGKPAVDKDGVILWGESGDRMYLKVEYLKTKVVGILNENGTSFEEDSKVIETLDEDFASFAMINK